MDCFTTQAWQSLLFDVFPHAQMHAYVKLSVERGGGG